MTSNQDTVAVQIIVPMLFRFLGHADEEVLMIYVNVCYFSAEVVK